MLRNRETRRFLGVRCGSYRCPSCAESNRRAFIKRVRLGIEQPNSANGSRGSVRPRFLTLTAKPGEAPGVAIAQLARRFQMLRQRVERRHPGWGFEYAVVVELTRAGMPHLHVCYRGPWVAQAEWSVLAEAVGFGYIVNVKEVRSRGVAQYAAKGLGGYLAKSIDRPVWPSHFRRVRFSRLWAPAWLARRRSAASAGVWYRVDPQDPEMAVWFALRAAEASRTLRGGQGPPSGSLAGAAERRAPLTAGSFGQEN